MNKSLQKAVFKEEQMIAVTYLSRLVLN